MKTLLVVGASSDVGIELIYRVVNQYDMIWAHYFHWNDKLEHMKAEFVGKIRFLQADLSKPAEIEAMIETIKVEGSQPDHIVHLPMSKTYTTRFTKTTWDDFETGLILSVRSAVTILYAFLPYMLKNRYGKVVYMLTSYTIGMPPKYQTAYVTAKYALLGLMKSLASEYADKNITFNGVSPDMIQTKFISDLPHLLVEQYTESRPMKKLLSAKDVIPVFEFLLSSGADHISGENILVQ